jgi:hypothetical protein
VQRRTRRTNRPSAQAGRQQRERLIDGEQRGGVKVFGWNPFGEGNLDRPVSTGRRVQLVDSGEALSGKWSATRTRAGQRRRWINVIYQLTKRVAITSEESRRRVTAKIS